MPREDEGRFRVQHQGPLLQSRGLAPWEEVAAGPFACFRPFTLGGRDYQPGEPVPQDVAEPRVLRNLYSARRIVAADPVEGDKESPPASAAPEAKRRGRPPRAAVTASA